MTPPQIEAGQIVANVLTDWPQTILVFTEHQMACVGCPIAPFETLSEVAVIYNLDLRNFLQELNDAIEDTVQIPAVQATTTPSPLTHPSSDNLQTSANVKEQRMHVKNDKNT